MYLSIPGKVNPSDDSWYSQPSRMVLEKEFFSFGTSEPIVVKDDYSYVKINGVYTKVMPYVKVAGSWVKASPYVKWNGVWGRSYRVLGVQPIVFNKGSATSENSPIVAASWTPLENDLVLVFIGTSTSDTSITAVSGWNDIVPVIDPGDSSMSMQALWHRITASEATNNVTSWTLSNLWGGSQRDQDWMMAVIRNVSINTPIDAAVAGSQTSLDTPFTLPGLTGTDLSNDSLVLSAIFGESSAITFTNPSGWTNKVSTNTNDGGWLGVRDQLTTSGVNVPSTTIVPTVGDEYCAVTVALKYNSKMQTISYGSTNFDSGTSKTASSFSVKSGDLLVVVGVVEDGRPTWVDPTATGLTFTKQVGADYDDTANEVLIWTAPITADATISNLTVGLSMSLYFGFAYAVIRNHDGVGTKANDRATVVGAPTLNVNTVNSGSFIVFGIGDWNSASGTQTCASLNGAPPTVIGNRVGGDSHNGIMIGIYENVGVAGNKTIGMSTPNTQAWTISAIEIKGV